VNVTDWLSNLGMGRYTAAFHADGITAEVVRCLTADDLKDLGVASIRHRRVLLRAIEATRACTLLDEPGLAPRGDRGVGHEYGAIAERRQLSVMFCDLVDSTALSFSLDPEDLSTIIRVYQSRVTTAVARFGGFVARFVGDGALVYFGWPAAHESNAEQAVRAALAVIEAVAEAPVGAASLQVRIGIATGLVVVGEPIGTGEARQHTAVGRTPNLAARLQSAAQPGCLVIDAATRRQIGSLFECQDLGPLALKGFPATIEAWQVATVAHRSRSQALHSVASQVPLLGRDNELNALSQCWLEAKGGRGGVVLLLGEPGIGKSRLVATLMERLGGESCQLRYFCSPQHQDSPLFPVFGAMATQGSGARDRAEAGRPVRPAEPFQVEHPDLIAAPLLGPDDDSPCARKSLPGQQHLLEAFASQLAEVAARRPVLVLFEDVHWIDPTSLELLDRLVPHLRSLPVLLVVSSRPGFSPPWVGLPHVSTLALGGLHRREALMLATRTAAPVVLAPTTLEQIVRRAEGLPLFVEELTRAVVEADWHDAAPTTSASGSKLPDQPVPAALYAPLAARIDRLDDVREVIQAAAVIGREFTLELLAGVTRLSEQPLLDALTRLGEARLMCRSSSAWPESYAFNHMLIRDVAYSMLLRDGRRQLHQRVAEVLRGRCREQGDAAPELLAHHYACAGLIEPAVRHWLLAGRRAFRMAAYREADRHLQKGIALLDGVPEGARRAHLASELRSAQSLARDAAKGYGHALQSVFAAWRGGDNTVLRLSNGGETPDHR
jgi:class 3 adenylate cyclase